MSDDLQERVARAIAYSGDIHEKREWAELLPETRRHYLKQADAALAEIGAVQRCAECDCDNPPDGCNWIATEPAPVKLHPRASVSPDHSWEVCKTSVALTDGRPCSTDVWLQCAVEQLDDHYYFMEAVKDWLHGDWEGAMECIELPTTHQAT